MYLKVFRLPRSRRALCRPSSHTLGASPALRGPCSPLGLNRRRAALRMRLRAGAACVVKQCVVKGGTLRVVWYRVQKREKWTPGPGP